ncbi:MAG TPA: hypothetical protein VF756_29280 [Thermoanaerobaculia bacterium]
MKKKIASLLVLAAAAGLVPAAGWAVQRDTALGAEGEIYTVRAGTYGTLFPGQRGQAAENVALALDVQRPDAATPERFLVRGTGTEFVESFPSLIFEESSKTVFLVWESRLTRFNPILMLAWFKDGVWSNPVEIIGNEFADKTPPQIAVTYDTYSDRSEDGEPVSRRRTLVHLLWGEKNGQELRETFYTALVLENGSYIGKTPVYKLDDLAAAEELQAAEAAPNLLSAPKLSPGRDERTVTVAFASASTQRVLALEIDVLPAQLSQLADEARAYIIDIGRRATAASLRSMADEARAYIIDIGVAFQPEVRRSIGELVHAYIRNGGPTLSQGGIRSLGDGARAYIIDIGAKLSGRGLQSANATSTAPSIREVDPSTLAPEAPGERRPSLLFQLRIASTRPAPQVGAGEIHMFVSENGGNVLIAWGEPGKVVYMESTETGWSERRELRLSSGLDLARAYEMLEQRVRNR